MMAEAETGQSNKVLFQSLSGLINANKRRCGSGRNHYFLSLKILSENGLLIGEQSCMQAQGSTGDEFVRNSGFGDLW